MKKSNVIYYVKITAYMNIASSIMYNIYASRKLITSENYFGRNHLIIYITTILNSCIVSCPEIICEK